MSWAQMQPMLQAFWTQSVAQLTERQAPGRLKQWLAMLTRNYPEAVELFTAMRRETDLQQVSRLLGMVHPEAALPSVGASLLAKDVNDNAGILI